MFLKNKKNIFKIRRSKVTDYATLNETVKHKNKCFIYNKKDGVSFKSSISKTTTRVGR